MKPVRIRTMLLCALLAAASGCVSREGYDMPDYRAPGGGWSPAYPQYGSGYGVYGPGYRYDPFYYNGYRGYDPFYYSSGGPGPYYYGYYPYPGYIVVPCVDNNHDGRCDRHPGHHDDGNGHDGQGHGDGNHHGDQHGDSRGDHDGNDHGGQRHQASGSAMPPLQQSIPPRVQPRAVPPSAPSAPAVRPQPIRPATGGSATQSDPPPKANQGARDDRPARPLIP